MYRLFKTVTALAVIPAFVFASAPATLAAAAGQIEGGDIYRVKNVTQNSAFANSVTADKCQVVQFKVRIHNPGPDPLTGVQVSATLPSSAQSSISSLVTVSAANANPTSVTDTASVTLPAAYSISYQPGSTQLLDPSNALLQTLPDGIVSGGVNVPGGVGVSLGQIRFVQFSANINCPVTPAVTPTPTPTPAPGKGVTSLPNTGPGSTIAIFGGVSALAGIGHYLVSRKQRA
jgi:uncharacterized repeat protein (TIGR01451 family)